MSLPKYYSQVCKNKPDDYTDYEHYQYKLGNHHNYEIQGQIGRGNYSDVHLGLDLTINRPVIIKLLKPVKSSKIRREIKILQLLNGVNNTIKLLDVVKFPQAKTPSLVFEYVNNACEKDFRQFYGNLNEKEIKYYMLEIVKGLDYINSKGIMHRDIKPHNIVIDHDRKRLKLIDFGLAEFYVPQQEYNVRVASRYFKAPELLLENAHYDYSVDMWSLGCLFAGILFLKEPFFAGQDNYEQLVKIAKVVGSDDIYEYMGKFNLQMNENIHMGQYAKRPFAKFINDQNRSRISEEALDLLEKMLTVDHTKRITTKEALSHPYFQTRYKSVPKQRTGEAKQYIVSKPKHMKPSPPKLQFKPRHQSPQPWIAPYNTEEKAKMKSEYYSTAKKSDRLPALDNQPSNKADMKEYQLESNEAPEANITVVVRVRPVLQKEMQSNDQCIVTTNDKNEVFIIDPRDLAIQQNHEVFTMSGENQQLCYYRTSMNKKAQNSPRHLSAYERNYSFDLVFGNNSTNKEIYEKATKQLTKVVLSGYNATIFAYGVTGAGKTHTMIGYESEPGLMYYTINEIFDGMRALNKSNKYRKNSFQVEVSFLEIYNEQIRDLVMPTAQGLDLREDPHNGIQIQGLSVFEVKHQDQIFELLAKGNANRTQESTKQNQTSSRSHAVLMITYQNKSLAGKSTNEGNSGKLSLIDLAGSERASRTGNTGLRMKEGASINKSLLALGNCINVLYENSRTGQQNHIPFRDSKLTRILKESLIGNSKTLMIANISPSGQNYEDTLNTLKYANRTKDLKTKIKKNVVAQTNENLIEQQNQHINQLQGEIESLKAELAYQKQMKAANQHESVEVSRQPEAPQNDDELFQEIKKHINEQFNEENGQQAQLKNHYIEYENLLFFQKRLKIDIFIQENKHSPQHQESLQQIMMLKEQLASVSSNEPVLLERIETIRHDVKNLIRKRNQLKEYMYDQFKQIKKRDYYGQPPPKGRGLTNIQAEILETLFHSNEQIIQNNSMKMKEQRLNIKMAKKEYMISCMAEQVGLRDFAKLSDMRESRNFLSKQQIDEILQEHDVPTEQRHSKRNSAQASHPSDHAPPLTKSRQMSRGSQFSGNTEEQLGRFICAQPHSPIKQRNFNKPPCRTRPRVSPSLDELPDQNIVNKASFNTSRSSSYNYTMVGHEQIPSEIYRKSKMKNKANDEAKLGIQLYRPQKKSIKITNVVKPELEMAGHQLRSKSARLQTAEEVQKQQQKLNQIQMKNKELFNQSRQLMSANPRYVSSASSSNTRRSEKQRESSGQATSKYEHYLRNQALYSKASGSQRGCSESKQPSPSTATGESRARFAKPHNNFSTRARSKLHGHGKSEQKPQVEAQPELNNSHYYKTQKHGLRSSKPSQDSEQTIEMVRSEELLNPNPGPDMPPPQSTFVSDLAKYSSNRQQLYKQVRASSKERKRRANESPNQDELLQEIQGVVDDVNQRISEYEEYKSSFADQEPCVPSGPKISGPGTSTKSLTNERRGSSSDKSSSQAQFASASLQQSAHDARKPPSSLYFMRGPGSSKHTSAKKSTSHQKANSRVKR